MAVVEGHKAAKAAIDAAAVAPINVTPQSFGCVAHLRMVLLCCIATAHHAKGVHAVRGHVNQPYLHVYCL